MGPPRKELRLSDESPIEVEEQPQETDRPAKKQRVADPAAGNSRDRRLAQLIDMGIDPELSAKAVGRFEEVDEAVEWIMSGAPNDVAIEEPQQSARAAASSEEAGHCDEAAGFSFLTYNVWFMDGDFAPDVKCDVRMKALAKIIDESKPDVIALQECTAKIVRLLQDENSLRQYSWSPVPHGAPYFTMMISRRSQNFSRLGFPMSQMGRDLLFTVPLWSTLGLQRTHFVLPPLQEAKLGFGQRIHVATSHLESAVPPYNGEALMSKERAQQLKCAAELLTQNRVRNCVYGGDMNWDETKNDGNPVKILNDASSDDQPWDDLWKLLHPSDPGYTYDGKKNDMLLNNMKMRLDRVFVKLKDYEPTSIEMVGTTKIPGATYQKETKRGSRTLPLLVSDHFGLLCAFQRKAGAGAGRSLR